MAKDLKLYPTKTADLISCVLALIGRTCVCCSLFLGWPTSLEDFEVFVCLLAFLTSEVFVSVELGSLDCFTLSLEGITFFCLFVWS